MKPKKSRMQLAAGMKSTKTGKWGKEKCRVENTTGEHETRP